MAGKPLQFRIVCAEDAERIQQLIESAFQADDSRADWVGDMDLASNFHIGVDAILPFITSPESKFLIATDPETGTIVGTIAVTRRDQDARLALLAVDPALHRGGIGRQVVRHAEDYCRRTWGANKLTLNALSNRPALISWYMRFGYQTTGEKTAFPHDRFPDMTLPEGLHFVELEKGISQDDQL